MTKTHKITLPIFRFILFTLIALLIFGIGTVSGSDTSEMPAENEKAVYLPIIMYHELKTHGVGKDVIYPYEFESDLKYYKSNKYTPITMNELISYVCEGGTLPEKPVMLTFDDGYLSTYVYAFPLIKKYNMKIVLSIIGKNTDEFTRIPDNNINYSHVTWAQLNEMCTSGCVEVQNHSYNLHKNYKSRLGCKQFQNESDDKYEKVLTEDLNKLQDEITVSTGTTPTTFAYPYGIYSKNTDTVLKKLGFKATLSCNYGINTITQNSDVLYRLKRICRAHNQPVGKLITEAYKTVIKR